MKSYFFYTDQLTVGYDGKPLIKEINIQLNKGEILTCLLYTSPSPRDVEETRMPSSA